jgi:RNA polymerase sigma factor (TIGR02999 family)
MRLRSTSPASGFTPADWGGTLPDRGELDYLFSVTYEELRRLAAIVRRSDPHATVSATTLVNEAWLKLASSLRYSWASELHFKRIAARAMRQLLIEAARRRTAQKRGGGAEIAFVTLDESCQEAAAGAEQLLVLDAVLGELSRVSPRQAMIVESRFFGGLEVAEVAELLNVSEATVLRDWRAAKAWLARQLRPGR